MKLFKNLFAATTFIAAGFMAHAQSADDIIAKHLAARGGADKVRALQSLTMEGATNVMGTDVQLRFFRQQGVGSKVEISVMGMTGYELYLPAEGWRFLPFQGMSEPQAMDADEVTASQDQLDVQGSLVDYKSKGHQIEFAGMENIEGSKCYKLVLVQKNGATAHYFIDSEYKLLRIVSKKMVNGEERENMTTYADYQTTPEGLSFARTWITARGEIKISDIKVNPAIEASVFKPGN
jgi:hypothetical protein